MNILEYFIIDHLMIRVHCTHTLIAICCLLILSKQSLYHHMNMKLSNFQTLGETKQLAKLDLCV